MELWSSFAKAWRKREVVNHEKIIKKVTERKISTFADIEKGKSVPSWEEEIFSDIDDDDDW